MANKTTSEKNKPTRKTLRADEYYNPKTKRYEYHYKDALGKERVVSSYRLEPTDQLPKGKRSGKSLREKEAELKVQLENNIDIDGAKLTLLEVIDRYLNHLYNRKELAHNTKVGYNTTIKTLAQYKLGHMEIGKIKPEHCEEWLSDMHRFLEFCSKDAHSAHCYDMIYVLFWTGLRASELCGLTLDNIEMENHLIRVEKQLQCINHTHVVLPTKTINGTRYIPMTDGVYECFQRILKNRYIMGDIEPVCYDEKGKAYEGFVFLATRSRKTIVRSHVEEYLQNCIKRFNNANPGNPIRKFEPHICRHTFATNMQELPPKTLQYILGHGNIATTMNNYVSVRPSEQQLVEINSLASLINDN